MPKRWWPRPAPGPSDRAIDVYRVDVTPAPGSLLERYPALLASRETRLWTRDERFVIEWKVGAKSWAWGRDERGRVWAAASPREGLRYAPDELPESLALACAARTLQLKPLLDDVLRGFRLRREADDSGLIRLRAEPRPGRPHPAVRSLVLEVDPATKEVRRLTLERMLGDRPLSTVTLTLIESGPRSDDDYRLESHLAPGAEVLDREHPGRRLAELLRLVGPGRKRAGTLDRPE